MRTDSSYPWAVRFVALAISIALCSFWGVGVTAQETPGARPVVWVLATGGTISGGGATPTSLTEYRAGTFSGEELVAAVPALAQHASIRVEQVANVGSPNITFDDWRTLARRIDEIFRSEPDTAGIVITHGTNTLEETAYFLNLTVRHDRPVVLVGAQRPATAISADGPLNLLNAVRTAASPEARGKGVLVVMNDEINAARDVTKTNTYRVETFSSRELGFLGYVDGDRVSFYRAPTKRHTAGSEFDLAGVEAFPESGHRLLLRGSEPGDDRGVDRGRCRRHRAGRHRRRRHVAPRAGGAGARDRTAGRDQACHREVEPRR